MNSERTAAAAAAAAPLVEEDEDDFFVAGGVEEVEAAAAADDVFFAAAAGSSADEEEARRGGAMGSGVTVAIASVPGVAAGEGSAEYMPFSSSTTGPSTMQMSHTRCRPFWPVLNALARGSWGGRAM